MAERFLGKLDWAWVDELMAPWTGWYRFRLVPGATVAGLRVGVKGAGVLPDRSWVITDPQILGFGVATAAIAAREVLKVDAAGDYAAFAGIPFGTAVLTMDVFLRNGEKFVAECVIGTAGFLGDRTYEVWGSI